MPELAECRKFVVQLDKEYGGKVNDQDEWEPALFLAVNVIGGKFLRTGIQGQAGNVLPASITFHHKGKFIYWLGHSTVSSSSQPNVFLLFQLGMTGSFGKKRNKHSAIEFLFHDKEPIYFSDPRRFGNVKFGTKQDLDEKLGTLGWDCLQEPLNVGDVLGRFRKRNRKPVGEALLDQGLFAGCGNYLRAELLFASHINPHRLISTLSDDELLVICHSYQLIASAAFEHGGATLATYSDLYGMAGDFFQHFKVYGKKNDPNGNAVVRETLGGRTIHWCPEVQK